MMPTLVVFVATFFVLAATAAYVARQRAKRSLTAKRFALAVTAGWSSAIAIFYFLGLGLASDIQLTAGIVGVGLGIVFLNLLLGYPTSVFVYKRILPKAVPEGKAPPDTP